MSSISKQPPAILDRYPQVRGNPRSMAVLCTALLDRSLHQDAFELGVAAVTAAPDDIAIRDLVAITLARTVPKWHVPMLHDRARNAAYRSALERAIRPGMIALEIGTGAGFLSLTAARLGARVYTCEANKMVAAAAQHIAEHNGLADRITVIPKLSSELQSGIDFPERADLLMSELFDDTLFGDGIVDYIGDAKERLLKPEAEVVPVRSALRLALVAFERPEKHNPLGDIDGFDLSAFNILAPRPSGHFRVAKLGATARSAAVTAMLHDFSRLTPFGLDADDVRLISTGGMVDGIAQWLHVDFGGGIEFENDPFLRPGSHWGSPVTPFWAGFDTEVGEIVDVNVRRYDRELIYRRG